ncbi:MAG TPA: shikimate kinase [Candidatus Eremiobacteraeota bacterium]|nr:MAG: Shikimate kinase [bacterium ADurb.Bin363]HPZ08834.1 shikimate kinase [Candidatus Eremiobacteraeota bacterium]
MNLILTGFMGSGKSTCGERLSKILSMDFIDTDRLIEEKAGISISEIFERFGEGKFREIERSVIEGLSNRDRCVIATGGGVVLAEKNMEILRKKGKIIYLKISYDKVMQRMEHIKTSRPLLMKGKDIKSLFESRKSLYEENDFEVDADRPLEEVIQSLREIDDRLISVRISKPETADNI